MTRILKSMKAIALPLAVFAASLACFAQGENSQSSNAQSDDINTAIEEARADIRANKVKLIGDAMQFNEKESAVFWPIYRRYENELTKLNDQRVQLIKTYADKFNTMTDADAKELAEKQFSFDSQRTDLRRKYFKEFNKELPATTVAKFFQLEHRLDLLMDLKIASELPPLLVKPPASAQNSTPRK
jgi:small-conductance mechanosensitive channel